MAAFLTLLFTAISGLETLVPRLGALVTMFAAACTAVYALHYFYVRAPRNRK
jgi:hypothetical protein